MPLCWLQPRPVTGATVRWRNGAAINWLGSRLMKIIRRNLALCLLSAASCFLASQLRAENPAGVGQAAALESLKRFTVADSLEVALFACEPSVRNPCDMDIDERGRLWITEGVN